MLDRLDAVDHIVKQLAFPRWADRISDMLLSALDKGRGELCLCSVVAVPKNWPRGGDIVIKRDDGVKMSLGMNDGKFVINKVS